LIRNYCLEIGYNLNVGDYYLFITSDRDRFMRERLEKVIGGTIPNSDLVHTEGYMRVYDISHLLKKTVQLRERGNPQLERSVGF